MNASKADRRTSPEIDRASRDRLAEALAAWMRGDIDDAAFDTVNDVPHGRNFISDLALEHVSCELSLRGNEGDIPFRYDGCAGWEALRRWLAFLRTDDGLRPVRPWLRWRRHRRRHPAPR